MYELSAKNDRLRMIACTAYMAGFDLKEDSVQTLVYACLAGLSLTNVFKKTGIKVGEKFAFSLVKKIPRNVLININKKVGFKLVTKFGEKGIINIGKAIPVVGAAIGGGLDLVETVAISKVAIKWFFDGDFTTDSPEKEEDMIDVKEVTEIVEDEDKPEN